VKQVSSVNTCQYALISAVLLQSDGGKSYSLAAISRGKNMQNAWWLGLILGEWIRGGKGGGGRDDPTALGNKSMSMGVADTISATVLLHHMILL